MPLVIGFTFFIGIVGWCCWAHTCSAPTVGPLRQIAKKQGAPRQTPSRPSSYGSACAVPYLRQGDRLCDAERSLGFRVFLTMQSRAKEYRINAAVCAMHAAAVPDPMKQFYQALELQWECLARQAEREALSSNEVDATKAAA
jgi:hypothetical protein